ncbi:MAG: hypothetical protein EXS00_01840 [Phycisphaerales bacterium]|nr:hypothetical protein [Phycisphaerales bacterium]
MPIATASASLTLVLLAAHFWAPTPPSITSPTVHPQAAPASRTPRELVVQVCAHCHCDWGNAPIVFDSLQKLRRSSPTAAKLLTDGVMPPWLAGDSGVGLHNPLAITAAERQELIAWFKANCPLTEDGQEVAWCTEQKPSGIAVTFANDWAIPHSPEGTVRSFVTALPPDAPRRIRGWRLLPQERGALEYLLLSADTTGRARELDAMDGATGSALYADTASTPAGSLGMIGVDPKFSLPDGYCFELPPGADLVAETHPRPLGRSAVGEFTVLLTPALAADRPAHVLQVAASASGTGLQRSGSFVDLICDPLDTAVDMVALFPRPGMRCSRFALLKLDTTGMRTVIFEIPHYRAWADRTYSFSQPVRLAVGDRLHLHIEHELPYWAAKSLASATLFVTDATTLVLDSPEASETAHSADLPTLAPCLTPCSIEEANAFRPEMMLIPPHGAVIQGSSALLIARTEVSRSQFHAVTGLSLPGEVDGPLPVVSTSWFDAVEYCNRLSSIEGLDPYFKSEVLSRDMNGRITAALVTSIGGCGYRLPSESEWEYAADAGAESPAVLEPAALESLAWFEGNSLDQLHEPGLLRPNAWGICDMAGNAWEWCADGWQAGAAPACKGHQPRLGANSGRVLKGGCFADSAIACHTSYRSGLPSGTRSSLVGVRIMRSCSQTLEQGSDAPSKNSVPSSR